MITGPIKSSSAAWLRIKSLHIPNGCRLFGKDFSFISRRWVGILQNTSVTSNSFCFIPISEKTPLAMNSFSLKQVFLTDQDGSELILNGKATASFHGRHDLVLSQGNGPLSSYQRVPDTLKPLQWHETDLQQSND